MQHLKPFNHVDFTVSSENISGNLHHSKDCFVFQTKQHTFSDLQLV